jgi:hypothetical protein
MVPDASAPVAKTVIPLIDVSEETIRTLRRRSVANLSCMGHCAPAVTQTLLDASGVDAPWLVKASGGLPGGIGNAGDECGGVTAPLMFLGLRHAHDPLDRGVPAVVYKGHDLLRRFTSCHGTALCREIRGDARVPLRCVGVVRRAPEAYGQTLIEDCGDAIPDESRQAFARLNAHFTEHGFHCARTTLEQLPPTVAADEALRDATSGFLGGTVFTGRTCGALTAGVLALGAALGRIEHSRLRVLRMIGLMAVGGDAFADDRNAFNRTMNLGHRLSRWFAGEFGSTQCRTITGCDFATTAGVRAYVEGGQVAWCIDIAQRVARRVGEIGEEARAA